MKDNKMSNGVHKCGKLWWTRGKRSRWLIIILIISLFILVTGLYLLSRLQRRSMKFRKLSAADQQREVDDLDTYQLVQEGCKIPLVHKTSKVLKQSFIKRLDPALDKCDKVPEFSRLDGNVLSLMNEDGLTNCCMREIQRPFIFHSDAFRFDPHCQEFDPQTRSLNVSMIEMMVVECGPPETRNNSNFPAKKKYNFHINVPLKGPIKKKSEYWRLQKESGRPRAPNIFVLVIDSTSRTDLYRNLPQMTDFLLHQMDFVDFRGHHPLGEPTMGNAIPLLSGLRVEEFWGTYKLSKKDRWDHAPFIWKTFNSINYITGYFEDNPQLGTFNYGGQLGFIQKPTDLYLRPLMVAHSKVPPVHKKQYCFGQRGVIKFMMDYHFETLKRFPDTPKLLISWPTWPQHDIGQSLAVTEQSYLEFFTKISQNQHIMDNTLFIVMSDHAYFKETYAKTHHGLLERRSVPLLIRIPNNMRRQNPQLLHNLLTNSEHITTHYDIYRTLVNLAKKVDVHLGDDDGLGGHHGFDLLQKKIIQRTCAQALIPQTMCSCDLPIPDDDNLSLMLGPDTKVPPLAINKSQFTMKA